MSTQFEHVDRPGPDSGSRLHPLDVREARPAYAAAALLRLLTSPVVLVAAMLVLWAVSDNPVSPVLGPVLGLTVTAYVERRFRFDAWARIPRRRQDLGRDEPDGWASGARVVELAALVAALLLYVPRVGALAGPTAVAAVAQGAMLALMFTTVATMAWDRTAPRDRRITGASSTVTTPFGVLVLTALVWGLVGVAGRVQTDAGGVAVGAAVVITAATGWLLLRLIPRRARCVPAGWDRP